MLAIIAFAVSALGPFGARSRYFWKASAVPGGALVLPLSIVAFAISERPYWK